MEVGRSGSTGRPLRVLYLEANEDRTTGGSHARLYRLVTHLPSDRFTPVVLFYRGNRFVSRLEDAGVEVHVWESVRDHERRIRRSGGRLRKWLDYLLAIWRRRDFMKRHEIDFMHINNGPWTGSDDWLPACRAAGIPVIANGSGVSGEGDSSRIRRWLARQYDGVMTVSRYVKEAFVRVGIDRDQIRAVYPGVDIEGFNGKISRSPADVRAELDVEPDQMFALMVGNVRFWKGQHVALEALSRLEPAYRDRIVVAFAGEPIEGDTYVDRIQGLIDEHELGDSVRVLGYRDDVPDLLNAADLAIHASVRPEPLGNVVLEALATGTPIVASAAGGPLEVLADDTGWLFDTDRPGELTDVIRRCLDDPSLLEEMGEKGRERVERFSLDRYVREVEEAYGDFLGLEGDGSPGSSDR